MKDNIYLFKLKIVTKSSSFAVFVCHFNSISFYLIKLVAKMHVHFLCTLNGKYKKLSDKIYVQRKWKILVKYKYYLFFSVR